MDFQRENKKANHNDQNKDKNNIRGKNYSDNNNTKNNNNNNYTY